MRIPPPQGTSSLMDQLEEWFNKWWNSRPSDAEARLLRELLEEQLVNVFRPTEVLTWMRLWNKRLTLSLNEESPRERVLCTLSCVVDTIYYLSETEIHEFVKWAAPSMGKTPQEFIDGAAELAKAEQNCKKGKLLDDCYDLMDVLAALFLAWQPGRSGLRPAMMDTGLREKMDTYISAQAGAKPESVITLLGGAAGNMADVLSRLGVAVATYWPYHPPDIAELCLPNIDRGVFYRVVFDAGKVESYPVHECGDPNHPKKRSIIFSYAPGFQINTSSGDSYGPKKIDRQIYRYPFFEHPDRNQGRKWTEIIIKDATGQSVSIVDTNNEILGDEGWPFLPFLGHWQVDGQKLVFTIADDDSVETVAADFDYILLSGVQGIGDPLVNAIQNQNAKEFVKASLQKHLSILAGKGARLHLELGGISSPEVATFVKEIIQNSVKSVGINQEELEDVTGNDKSPFFLARRPDKNMPPEGFSKRYERARHLAKLFDQDEFYVHGNDADLILVRGISRGAIRQQLLADLFAKGVIVLALLMRSYPNDWQAKAAELEIILKKEGLVALLTLADYIAKKSEIQDARQQDLLRDIAFSGYWFNRDTQDYSVMAVPVMWPELPPTLTTSGAGDSVSATFAIFGRK
jgi:ADP-dependent phosphofructokinase/glucokinase